MNLKFGTEVKEIQSQNLINECFMEVIARERSMKIISVSLCGMVKK